MIDYGEDKQNFGTPKIDVGPISQLLTALYIGIFLLSFFIPQFAADFLAQINADLPEKFWTLLTGIFVFPESTEQFSQVPSGFWVIVTFMLIFLVVRPLEQYYGKKASFIIFLLLFMLIPALIIWAISPGSVDASGTWPFWFNGAAGLAAFKFRKAVIKLGEERKIPQLWGFVLIPAAAVISSAATAQWGRMILFLLCALLGVLWGFIEERKNNIPVSR